MEARASAKLEAHLPRFGSRALLLCAVSFIACEKAPTPASTSPDVSDEKEAPHPAGTAAPAQMDENLLPASEREPGLSAPAVEPAAGALRFDDSASKEFTTSFESLQTWVTKNGGKLYAALVDLETDKWLVRAQASEPMNPASNAKLLTTAAALELLGPAHHFTTELFGTLSSSGSAPRIVLRGGGAPDLTTADLWRLLRVARGQGLTAVGDIVVDQSRFTEDFLPPAYEQQPGEWAPFRAPVSALAVEGNAVSLNVLPQKAGHPARVWHEPPGLVTETGSVETSKSSSGDHVTWSLDPKAEPQQPKSIVGGRIAEGLGRMRYFRRLEDPRLGGGYILRELMKEAGISVSGKVSLGTVKGEDRIAVWNSRPLAELVRALGKDSDNFTAEMLFISLCGAAPKEKTTPPTTVPWSSACGAKVVMDWLKQKKLPVEGIVVKNGSGLFDSNRLSAELLTSILASVEDNPRIYQDYVSHLAMGATDGTLKTRFKGNDLGQRIRAKTGTLREVSALSGYIQRPNGKSPAAFSLTVVGVKRSHPEIRAQVDALVLAWAKTLDESSSRAPSTSQR